jgi:hypothetical protein
METTILNQDYIVKKHSRLFHDYYCEVVLSSNNFKLNVFEKLKSEKFVIDLFCKTFFGFTIFKNKFDE